MWSEQGINADVGMKCKGAQIFQNLAATSKFWTPESDTKQVPY
jgi:hypothetical protein